MSLWDQFELFLAVDAAGLVIPTNDSEKKALLNKMRDSYEKAVDQVFSKCFELTYPGSQVNSNKVRYRSISDQLPESLFYSRALDMQGRVLFRPDQGKPYRILYAFDPLRNAILLIGGDKTGDDRWYEVNVPIGDRLYDELLEELRKAGKIDD